MLLYNKHYTLCIISTLKKVLIIYYTLQASILKTMFIILVNKYVIGFDINKIKLLYFAIFVP